MRVCSPTPAEIADAQSRLGWTDTQCATVLDVKRVAWSRWKNGVHPLDGARWRYFLHATGIKRLPWHKNE